MNLNRTKLLIMFLIFITFWVMTSCENPFLEDKKSKGYENQKPETYLFLDFTSDTLIVNDTISDGGNPVLVKDTVITSLDTTASKQIIHWWGEDADGEIIGYYYKWNFDSELTFSENECDTFYVPIRQKYDIFTFEVYAVDNDSAIDPTPAKLSFPVYNSRPTIDFRLYSNPPVPKDPSGNPRPNVTSITFPTRTFVWDAIDPDGNETIKYIYWALDDTTEWNKIECNGSVVDRVTLRNIPAGSHQFFAKTLDIAGALSRTIMFPDENDDEIPNNWVVKEPVGDILVVDDYYKGQQSNDRKEQKIYTDLISEITGDQYSLWEIGDEKGGYFNVENSLPYTSTDIEAYLDYFPNILWFSKTTSNHLSNAGLSITKYVKEGGNILIFNGSKTQPDTTWKFTNIDSVYYINPDYSVNDGSKLIPTDTKIQTENPNFPQLSVGDWIFWRTSGLILGDQYAEILYKMEDADSLDWDPKPYEGTPTIAVHYEPNIPEIKGESIYFSLPLSVMNGNDNIKELLEYILNEEFKD